MTEEIWRLIPCANNYEVSSCGRVRSLFTNKIMATARNPHGYVHLTLRAAPKVRKTFDVHRLMMLAFFGPSELTVNHKNGVKFDNRLENLEYATRSQNQRHALDELGFQPIFGERHPYAKFSVADIIAIRNRAAGGDTITAIANDYRRSSGLVCDIIYGKLWRHAPGPIRK